MTAAVHADPPVWTRKHLLTLEDLSRQEIEFVLDTAKSFQEVSTRSVKKVPALRGRVVVNLFFEESTRTRMSFTLAAQRLSADVLDFSARASSTAKGESLRDTARNIEAMGVDIMVLRHSHAGAAYELSTAVDCCVINAGDGQHAHPTQALLDLFTIRERMGRIEGLNVAIVGDIAHSRVARSDLCGLMKLGANVTLVGPPTLVPRGFEKLGARVSHDFDAVLPEMDVVNMLRIQKERITSSVFPSTREYVRLFGMDANRMQRCKPDVLLMHPGPVNRGIELAADVADGPQSSILRQVTNGLAVRMAVLFLCQQAAGAPAR
ncbi:MAG: aspartate carbamoyltransferase catalytic subunit [Planctomycetota bacterium]|nr:MAG: aspartate carbamoyltransferase catalytic subunit [Planctomycetota bacterium]